MFTLQKENEGYLNSGWPIPLQFPGRARHAVLMEHKMARQTVRRVGERRWERARVGC